MSKPQANGRSNADNPFRATEWGIADTVSAPDITAYENPSEPAPAPRPPARPALRAVPPVPVATRKDPSPVASVIEVRHPEIARSVSLMWGYPEMNEYFDRIWLAENSHGPIDPEAMSELMLLSRVHQLIVPQRPGRSLADMYGANRLLDSAASGRDTWSDIPYRR